MDEVDNLDADWDIAFAGMDNRIDEERNRQAVEKAKRDQR